MSRTERDIIYTDSSLEEGFGFLIPFLLDQKESKINKPRRYLRVIEAQRVFVDRQGTAEKTLSFGVCALAGVDLGQIVQYRR